jgi:hypothetical protein
MKTIFALGTAVALAIAAPATAAQITYTISGTLDGGLDGTEIFGAETIFTAIGETTNTFDAFGNPQIIGVPLTSVTLTFSGGTFAVSTPAFFVSYAYDVNGAEGGRLGLSFDNTGFNGIGLESTAFSGYNGLSNFATTGAATYFQTAQLESSAGALTISSFTNATFTAVVEASAAVPEPATWSMMLLGFGLVGAGMRRRKTTLIAA